MRMLGLRTYRDHICWASVDGPNRVTATVTGHGTLQIPGGQRGAALAWVRQEVAALVGQEKPEQAAVCPTEGQTVNTALIERAQIDGVVLEALHFLNVPTQAKKSATIRSHFGARNRAELATALGQLPVIAMIPPTSDRRDPVIAAVSELPN